MQKQTIGRIVTGGMTVLTLTLGVFAFRNFSASTGDTGRAAPAAAAAPEQSRTEIHLPEGTDANVIQTAIRRLPLTGGKIVLAAGTYPISRPLVIDRDDVELTGDNGKTILRLEDRANCPLLVIGSLETPVHRRVSNVIVRNLVLDGNRTAQQHECIGGACDAGGLSFIRNNAITIRGAEDVRVEHVKAMRARSGGMVLEKECREIRVRDFEASDNHFDGFAAYETEHSTFTQLYLHSNAAAGISADIRFNRNRISYCRLENNGSQGIFMRDSSWNQMDYLTISGNGAQGIFIAQADTATETRCTGNVFSNLDVTNSKGPGFRVNDASCVNNMLADSTFTSNAEGVSEVHASLIVQQNVVVK